MNVSERTAGFSDYLMHYSNFARFALYRFKFANPAELPKDGQAIYPDEKQMKISTFSINRNQSKEN